MKMCAVLSGLNSASSKCPDVPFIYLSTVGGRAFSGADSGIWNSSPDHITAAETFSELTKTFLFECFFFFKKLLVLAVNFYSSYCKNLGLVDFIK